MACGQRIGAKVDHRGVLQHLEPGAGRPQSSLDFRLIESRTEIRAFHAVPRFRGRFAGLPLEKMICGERRTERAACVPGGRLYPETPDVAVAQNLSVGHAIEGDTPRKAQVAEAGFRHRRPRQPQHDLLGRRLDRRRKIHLALR